MSITHPSEMEGMKTISSIVAVTLRKMREYARPGMSTLELDAYGGNLLLNSGARSAPMLAYQFPGYTCISRNEEIAHGIPTADTVLQEGDLINIDVSAELNGFWADNGGSFVLGRDIHHHQPLVDASRKILYNAIRQIRSGTKINETGRMIEWQAKRYGYKVIRNLTGHGVGRSLHEEPAEIPCYYDRYNQTRFRKNMVVAVETFISTRSADAIEQPDGWTLRGRNGGFTAQHEHTIIVTEERPDILTLENDIWN